MHAQLQSIIFRIFQTEVIKARLITWLIDHAMQEKL